MGKEALVVKREILFKDKSFQGYLNASSYDFISIILKNHFYQTRGNELEENKNLQQIIPYVWIINPNKKFVFLYKRTANRNKKDGEYKETRYLNKFSGGVGGHIDRDTEEGSENPIFQAMMRELKEEVIMTNYPEPRIIGYINDDTDSIGKVHFGLIAICETNQDVHAKAEEGLLEGKFYTIQEVESIFSDEKNQIENWTRISWPFVRECILPK
ncbi:NUDIX domain-containing protein [Candidatus Pacearchaeota archaeon]|nr:NUDIX domain-containing protein [Candidatus Pacearchaeota archaeon]